MVPKTDPGVETIYKSNYYNVSTKICSFWEKAGERSVVHLAQGSHRTIPADRSCARSCLGGMKETLHAGTSSVFKGGFRLHNSLLTAGPEQESMLSPNS